MKPLPVTDLRVVAEAVAPLLAPWRGRRLLVTGATGFFGRWLLESALRVNADFGANLQLIAQSRDPERFVAASPHLGSQAGLRWWKADPRQLAAAEFTNTCGGGAVDAIIHLVTEADGEATLRNPRAALATIVDSTRQVLELARAVGAARVLFTSSGSVYGRRAASLASADGGGVAETDWGVLDAMDTATAYAISGQAKRAAEQWCAAYHREHGLNVVVARCFTFLGPGMPLAGKFAAGNFLADALGGRDIVIRGDGTAVRSYLYASDLAIWLWRLLLEGPAGRAYNVGAEEAVSLRELAEIVREEVAPQVAVRVLGEKGPSGVADVYVPRTAKAREELGLRATVSLREAVRRTADWLGCSRPR